MKRPICAFSIAIMTAILLYFEIYPPTKVKIPEQICKETILDGVVIKKEINQTEILVELRTEQKTLLRMTLREGEVEPFIGEHICVRGIICEYLSATNPGQFDVRAYYERRGIAGYLQNPKILMRDYSKNAIKEMLYQVRCFSAKVLSRILPSRSAGLMQGILLGMQKEIEPDIKKLYQDCGIAHILAISGLHISLLGMGLYRLLRKTILPAFVILLLSIILMFLYGIMTGMSNSSYRAILMFSLQLTARQLKRTYDMLTGLAIAAILILIEQPLYLYDGGFQLSFLAVAGLGILSPLIKKLYDARKIKNKLSKKVLNSVISAMSVQLMTLPVMLWFYYEIPVYSLFLNLLIIPMAGAVLASGMAGLLLGSIFTIGGIVFAYPAHILLVTIERLCRLFEKIPNGTLVTGRPTIYQIGGYYLTLALLLLLLNKLLQREGKKQKKCQLKILFPVIVIGCILLLLYKPRHLGTLFFLDVGQGDCAVILDRGYCILIDGGSSTQKEIGKNVITPFLKYFGQAKIDFCVITHPDTDHMNGIIEMMDAGDIEMKCIMIPASLSASENFKELFAKAEVRNVEVIPISSGVQFGAGDSVFYTVHPDKGFVNTETNAHSVVLYANVNGAGILFTGDVTAEEDRLILEKLKAIMGEQLSIEVLKVAHHGSAYSTTDYFLKALKPKVAVLSVGKNNRYGHPHPLLLKRLEENKINYVMTSQMGAISVH